MRLATDTGVITTKTMKKTTTIKNLIIAFLFGLIMNPVFANAQTLSPNEQSEQRAKELFDEGSVKYKLGNFLGALIEFRAALKFSNRPSILFNIAQCHRQFKQAPKALFYYKLYLSEWSRLNPNKETPYKEEILIHIKNLEDEVQKAEKENNKNALGITTKAPPINSEDKTTQNLQQIIKDEPQQQPKETKAPIPIYKKWWFWTLVGSIATGITTATYFGVRPQNIDPPNGTLSPGKIQLE